MKNIQNLAISKGNRDRKSKNYANKETRWSSMVVNMRAGAYSTISVQACDHSTPAAPELDQGSCMHTVLKATNLISPIWYLFLYLDIILGNEHRARDLSPSHPEHRYAGRRSPVTRTNTTTNTRWTIYLTRYPSWQLHKRQEPDPQLATHTSNPGIMWRVGACPPTRGVAINCNKNKTQQPKHTA